MSLPQGFPPTELEIHDITGSDLFPGDLKVFADLWVDYHCLCRKWECFDKWACFDFCHWLFLSPHRSSNSNLILIMEKIKSILRDLDGLDGRGDFLVQYWELRNSGEVEERGTTQDRLTSRKQPFGLNSTNIALYAYASMSRFWEPDATSERQHFGLPKKRVFPSQWAEFTTQRRAYRIRTRAAAVDCNITASLTFPPFNFWNCASVIEIVTDSDRPTNEIYEIFRDITSKHADKVPVYRSCVHLYEQNDKKEKALEEIKKSLEEVRRIHDIPLSLTWIPCRMCDALFHIHQVSKTEGSSHLPLNSTWRRIKKGQGAVGKAFLSNKLEFCEDVSRVSETEYPLTYMPLNSRSIACFAIPLRSGNFLNEEDDIYVVEFFLPPNYVKFGDWRTTAYSSLSTMRQHLKSVSIASRGEIGEDLPIDDKHVENGGETIQLDTPNQEKEKNVTTHTENNKENCTEETNTTISSSQQKVQHRKAGIPISYELLEQHFGMKLEEAAKSIGVSRSTLKRASREYNITWWPSGKRKSKANHFITRKSLQHAAVEKQIEETSDTPISNPSGDQHMETNIAKCAAAKKQIWETKETSISDPSSKQHMETNISTELHDQDISTVTIKAKFGANDFIKFKLPIMSGIKEFQHQVEKRLHWKDGTYSVRYQDEDNDSILVSCDEDLQDYMCNSKAMGRNTVTVSLQPITNFSNCPF